MVVQVIASLPPVVVGAAGAAVFLLLVVVVAWLIQRWLTRHERRQRRNLVASLRVTFAEADQACLLTDAQRRDAHNALDGLYRG